MRSDIQSVTPSLDLKRATALRMMVAGASRADVASALGVCLRAVDRYREDAGFQLAMHAALRERLPEHSVRVDVLWTQALELLEAYITDPTLPAPLRLLAAQAVLEHGRQPVAPPTGRGRIRRSSFASVNAMVRAMSKAGGK
jgi:hypothetical protein